MECVGFAPASEWNWGGVAESGHDGQDGGVRWDDQADHGKEGLDPAVQRLPSMARARTQGELMRANSVVSSPRCSLGDNGT